MEQLLEIIEEELKVLNGGDTYGHRNTPDYRAGRIDQLHFFKGYIKGIMTAPR